MSLIYPRESLAAHPPHSSPNYRSTVLRAPKRPLVIIPHSLSELSGPAYGHDKMLQGDADLTAGQGGEPLGERMTVSGRVLDEAGRPIPDTLIEIWQANAAGRYIHVNDQHAAPLDPHFVGAGRCVTDAQGRYRFQTIKPGAYPWRNHHNAWRPAHIHLSLFGPSFISRLVTQMYFPNDPLFPFDPIFQSIPDANARNRLISRFELDLTQSEWALGYRFDIVLRGREATPMEEPHDH
jgi:protocatechuate 3,4-dioxygenase, beta subunit